MTFDSKCSAFWQRCILKMYIECWLFCCYKWLWQLSYCCISFCALWYNSCLQICTNISTWQLILLLKNHGWSLFSFEFNQTAWFNHFPPVGIMAICKCGNGVVFILVSFRWVDFIAIWLACAKGLELRYWIWRGHAIHIYWANIYQGTYLI